MPFMYQVLTEILHLPHPREGPDPADGRPLFTLLFVFGPGFQLGFGSVADRFGNRPVVFAIDAIGEMALTLLLAYRGSFPSLS